MSLLIGPLVPWPIPGYVFGFRWAPASRYAAWMKRVTDIYEHCVWLNPVPEHHWGWTPSIKIMREAVGGRMYPLTLGGLDRAMKELMR